MKAYKNTTTALFLRNAGWKEEYKFHETRKWRMDWALPNHKIAIEIEGGVWVGGRHTSGAGFVKDMEKYNSATVLGWRILRYTPQQFEEGICLADIESIVPEPF